MYKQTGTKNNSRNSRELFQLPSYTEPQPLQREGVSAKRTTRPNMPQIKTITLPTRLTHEGAIDDMMTSPTTTTTIVEDTVNGRKDAHVVFLTPSRGRLLQLGC